MKGYVRTRYSVVCSCGDEIGLEPTRIGATSYATSKGWRKVRGLGWRCRACIWRDANAPSTGDKPKS